MLGTLGGRNGISSCGFRELCHVLFGRRVFRITCRHVCTGPNGVAPNASKGAVGQVDLREVGGIVTSLESRSCGPGPTGEVCVPGGGNGGEPLKVPSFRSGLMRRIIHVVLRTICRRIFTGASRKFEPGEDYRATLARVRGAFANAG